MEAGFDNVSQVEPDNNTEDRTGDDFEPDQCHICGDPLSSLNCRLRLSKGLCAVEDGDTKRQTPDDGGNVHAILIGKVRDEVIRDEEAFAHDEDGQPGTRVASGWK